MNLSASNTISASDWNRLRHGSKITDHDGHVWEVVYIDRAALRGEVHIARQGARSGSEVCIALDATTSKITVLYGEQAEALTRPARRHSGVHRLPIAA